MFAARYFARRYFAPRYWPKVGALAAPPPPAPAPTGFNIIPVYRLRGRR